MRDIRYFLESAILSALLFIFRHQGIETASNFGGWIGRTIGPVLPASRTALDNLSQAFPEKTPAEKNEILLGMWDNLGRLIAEYPHLEAIIMTRCEIVGEQNFIAIGEHNPCVVISAHLANWELAPFYFNYLKRWPMSGIYRAPNNPYVRKIIEKLRIPVLRGAYIPKSQQGVRDMVRVLKRGERLGNLIDQKYNNGMMIPFFGRPAPTSSAFAQLAEKFQCPLLPLQIERLPNCRFRLTLHEPFLTAGKTNEEVVIHSTRMIEEWIRQRPEQWLWIHRRWGKPPKP